MSESRWIVVDRWDDFQHPAPPLPLVHGRVCRGCERTTAAVGCPWHPDTWPGSDWQNYYRGTAQRGY